MPVPEPSTWMMLLGGLLLPWVVSRRQRARAA
ncbi:MAG: PEP-CTERM sorting domain-containing protein [Janthinobacterium sp.]